MRSLDERMLKHARRALGAQACNMTHSPLKMIEHRPKSDVRTITRMVMFAEEARLTRIGHTQDHDRQPREPRSSDRSAVCQR